MEATGFAETLVPVYQVHHTLEVCIVNTTALT